MTHVVMSPTGGAMRVSTNLPCYYILLYIRNFSHSKSENSTYQLKVSVLLRSYTDCSLHDQLSNREGNISYNTPVA